MLAGRLGRGRFWCAVAVVGTVCGLGTLPLHAADTAATQGVAAGVNFNDPALSDHIKVSGADVSCKIVNGGFANALEVTVNPGKASYPGITLTPPGGTWDFSHAGSLTAHITNLSDSMITVTLRVDNAGDWRKNPWNATVARIKPKGTADVVTTFGYSFDHPGYALDPGKVTQLLVISGKPKTPITFRIDSITATGAPGDKPKNFVEVIKPVDGKLFAPAPEAAGQSKGSKGALASAPLTFPATVTLGNKTQRGSESTDTLSPPAHAVFNLTDYNAVAVMVSNPNATAVPLRIRVDDSADASRARTAEVTLAPHAQQVVTIPFANATPGVLGTPKSQPNPTPDQTNRFSPDHVTGITFVNADGKGGEKVEVHDVVAVVPAPAVLPAWVGERPPVPGEWTKTFDDEFAGKTIDDSKWAEVDAPKADTWDHNAIDLKDNCYLQDGKLIIRAEKKPTDLHLTAPKLAGMAYATGFVTTFDKFAQKYGYFEARMKLPTETPGMWPAFWLMPDRGKDAGIWWKRQSTANGGMEFDIMEYLSRFGPYHYNIAMHWDGYGKDHKATGTENNYFVPDKDGYVTAGLLWQPGKVTYYAQGKPVLEWSNSRIAALPEYILLTMPTGGWGGNEVVPSKLPGYFTVDYVRVWANAAWK